MYVNYRAREERRTGFLQGERLLRIEGPSTDRMVVEGFPAVPEDAPRETDPVEFLPAVLRPGKILCLLRSYRAHAEESGGAPPPEPVFFAKLPNALLGHEAAIRIPPGLEGEVHHEGELALVLGAGGRDLEAPEAAGLVAAYTVANDVTARTLQRADAARGWPWTRAKSFDTFLPLGPGLVPASEVEDPRDLSLEVRVNGEVRQRSRTGRLLYTIGEVLSRLSRYVTLEAGDVVLTGTPEGVGPLRPGDVVEVEIEGVGRLVNPVRGDGSGGGRAAGAMPHFLG